MSFQKHVLSAQVAELGRDHIRSLTEKRLGAIRVSNFLGTNECQQIYDALVKRHFESYSVSHYDTDAIKLGPSLNDHRFSREGVESYWESASRAWREARSDRMLSLLHDRTLDHLGRLWADGVEAARSKGRNAYWGIIRRMTSGTLVHWDNIREELPATIFDSVLDGQVAVNVFVKAPRLGGRLMVWSRQREMSHEGSRVKYGYIRERVVPEDPEVAIQPMAGEAVFFAPGNYHLVEKVLDGDRVTFSFFMGIAPNAKLVLWS